MLTIDVWCYCVLTVTCLIDSKKHHCPFILANFLYILNLYLSNFTAKPIFFYMREVMCVCVLWSLPTGYPALPISLLSYGSIPISCLSCGLLCHSPPPVSLCCLLYSLTSQGLVWKHPMDRFWPCRYYSAYSPSYNCLCLCYTFLRWWWYTAQITGNKLSYVLCLMS